MSEPVDLYLCIPKCIKHIAETGSQRGVDLLAVARRFEIALPRDVASIELPDATYSDDPNLWGARVTIRSIAEGFRAALDREVQVSTIRAAEYEEWLFYEAIDKARAQGFAIIATLDYSRYSGCRSGTGHAVVVLDEIDSETVSVWDPGPKNAGFRSASKLSLFGAIRTCDGSAWVISL